MEHNLSDLDTLPLPADEGFLHHAVVLAQHPVPVYRLGVNGPRGRDAVGSESVFLRGLRGPLGVVDVEDHVSFRHVKVPGDDGGGLVDLDQHLQEEVRRRTERQTGGRSSNGSRVLQRRFLPAGGTLIHRIESMPPCTHLDAHSGSLALCYMCIWEPF